MRRHLLAEISEGARWLWRQRLLRALVAIASAGNLAFSALGLTIIVRATDLGPSSTAVTRRRLPGDRLGARPVGALLGGISLETHGAVPTFAALATWLAIVAAASTASRQVRRASRPETCTEQP